jgi:catechol-2,3-dioxygenase
VGVFLWGRCVTLLGKMAATVVGAASVELAVTDLVASTDFYGNLWRLVLVDESAGRVYLRGAGRRHHVLCLTASSRAQVMSMTLAAADKRAVDATYERVRALADAAAAPPSTISGPGGGYGFAFRDLDGRTVRVIAEDAVHPDVIDDTDRPAKISHVVLNSPRRAVLAAQYCTIFGLKAIDETRVMTFLCAGGDHHFLALADHDAVSLNHIAFEVNDIDALMRGVYRLREHGTIVEWGVGRHGPGHNIFAYFIGPDGEIIEYTCDVLQVDQNYLVGGPSDWVWPPGRIDHWNTPAPSGRYVSAQGMVPFTTAGDAS